MYIYIYENQEESQEQEYNEDNTADACVYTNTK
jgi:hypothetical protein